MVVCAPWCPCPFSTCLVGSFPAGGHSTEECYGGDAQTSATCQEERGWTPVALTPQEHSGLWGDIRTFYFRRLLQTQAQSAFTLLIPADGESYEGNWAHRGFRICDSSRPVQTHLGGKQGSFTANPGRFLPGIWWGCQPPRWFKGASCSSYGGLSWIASLPHRQIDRNMDTNKLRLHTHTYSHLRLSDVNRHTPTSPNGLVLAIGRQTDTCTQSYTDKLEHTYCYSSHQLFPTWSWGPARNDRSRGDTAGMGWGHS